MNWIKKLFQKNEERQCAISVFSKRLEDEGHWSDDWEKAEYKIKKCTNANGYRRYYPYRTLNGKTELATMSSKFGYDSEEGAREAIRQCKDFHREAWNHNYTKKTELIHVD